MPNGGPRDRQNGPPTPSREYPWFCSSIVIDAHVARRRRKEEWAQTTDWLPSDRIKGFS